MTSLVPGAVRGIAIRIPMDSELVFLLAITEWREHRDGVHSFEARLFRFTPPVLPHACCVTLGKSLTLCVPQCPQP